MSKYKWVKIGSCDWTCELSNGDTLRVERMNSNFVWWCFHSNGNSFHCYENDDIQRTINGAKLAVESSYKKYIQGV